MAEISGYSGSRILLARKEMDITRAELARRVQVTMMTVYNWEVGNNQPNGEALYRVAKALGRPVEWFYEGDGATGAA